MKKFRKVISKFLLVIMLFNYFTPFIEVGAKETNKEESVSASSKEEIPANGNIELEVQLVLPIRNRETSNITYKIYDSNGNSASLELNEIINYQDGFLDKNIKLKNQSIRVTATKRDTGGNLLSGVDYNNNIVYFSVNVYGLSKGNYEIELSGNHFVTYKVPVTLDNYSKRVSLTNETGMFEIGDVNGDLKVSETDANLMLEAIDKNNSKYDLNLDGVTDIADLNYITAILNGTKKNAEIEDTSAIIDSSNVSLNLNDNIEIEGNGSLTAIFNDEDVLTLKRSDNKEVSEENPISLEVDLGSNKEDTVKMSEIRISVGENAPKTLKAIIDGKEYIGKRVETTREDGIYPFTEDSKEGDIVIDLKGQIAVKKVTIVVTETGSNNLADIAKVEFLNNVKVETKEPDNFYTPRNIEIDGSVSEQLTVNFQSVPNVTGYEIKITGPKMEKGVIFQTTFTSFTIEDLKNYATYKISVQSVNQEWESGWSEEYEGMPIATRRPPAPDMVTLTPIYSGFDLTWKDMDDTKTYNIYYKETGASSYEVIRDIKGTSYTLKGLKDAVEYEAYLTGNNDLGEGSKSQTVKGKTLKADATITPKYKLINKTVSGSEVTSHIKDVLYSSGEMISGNKFSMVDDNYLSYWEVKSWMAATHYYGIGVPIIVLDKPYKMDEFVITVPDAYPYSYKSGTTDPNASNKNDVLLHYWNGETNYNANNKTTVQGQLITKKDENNRVYYVLKLDEPITADAIQIGLTVTGNGGLIQVAEVKLYEYDSLVDEVGDLFADDLRVELKKGVTKEKIEELKKRADVKDNGEYNPYREVILNDLQYALDILNDKAIQDVITLNPNISNSYNGHTGFAMTINDYQPLGVVARPNEKLTVYVGTKGNVNVELVFTQFYAEANKWQTTVRTLQKGQNIIDVPKIGDAEAERGGSVYVRYTSTPNANTPIKIRVSGGEKIPVLDTSLLKTESEKKDAIKTYLNALNKHVTTIKENYGSSFDKQTSVSNSTEIVTEKGLFSVAATAVLDAVNSGTTTTDSKINRLYKSTEAFDEMMEMFYRQKGLKENAEDAKDEMPKARSNIRYMRMFDGAFMYAGGYHIGIEYGSIAGLIQAEGNSSTKTGYFGWGISHEVGHQINQRTLAHAEVTNNVYALLAQTSNDKDKSRLETSEIYPKIYEKVTSHTIGKAQNVFVQLGMYWQLHLAYDDNNTFSDTNSIYSRINHLTRTYDNKDNYSKDDLLILFSSMAASRDLTDFFEVWGLKATDKLKAYIKDELKLAKETRQIQYLNDEARRYRINDGSKMASDTKVVASIEKVDNQNKEVTLNFKVNKDEKKILGYEILRNGVSIAFIEGNVNTYVDRIGAENNRAYTYTIVAYDYLLNKTPVASLAEIKVSYDGSIASKDTFEIESNVKVKGEIVDLEDSDMDYSKLEVNKLIDGNNKTSFNGTEKIKTFTLNGDNATVTTDNNNAYVIINLNAKYDISGLKYQALSSEAGLDPNSITKYKIYVSSDKENWQEARVGTFNLTKENNYTDTVYFKKDASAADTSLWTYYDVSYVKIVSDGKNSLSGSEIDLIAPPGDNIDISVTENNVPTIGVLDKDYTYDASLGENGVIKAGSVIIKGEYRGSPSFNVLTITDATNGTIYNGYQLIFAEVNPDMTVYEVASGTWMYIMTKDEYQELLKSSKSIRANLYRVNDAISMENQRLTSTSKAVSNLETYDKLPKMSIDSSKENN